MKIPHFIGVFTRDRLSTRPKRQESAIINLDAENGTGTHWVAYRKIGKKVDYYDSFGNLPPPLEVQQYFQGCDVHFNYSREYLATGTHFAVLHFDFRIGKSTFNGIVRETCQALWSVLQPTEIPKPNKGRWIDISKTNFPNCLGAIDGKHVRCKNPENSGSLLYNYKKYFSIILMAVVDANLNFIYIDVGAYGREADSSVFRQSVFGKMLYSRQLQIPASDVLSLTENNIQPYVFVADEAFGLHANLLRPFPGRGLNSTRQVFNYSLSRARRTVECAFGVLANKWRVLHTTILVEPDFCDDIIKACCVLHNFVRKRDGYNYDEETDVHNLENLTTRGRNINRSGIDVRDNFADYFMADGAVPFQYRIL
ncbi:uncharacterized protein LOC132923991 [Rhopalosiphum padi]|uniref:uncharacterized protein LOC132923991 n=1 Tax=Rhopalosiphum padi TaxID=40932 RepID=UPI00298E312E|nr:uncharacterized protein LOC132923991 [Rhopalosiphum padi]